MGKPPRPGRPVFALGPYNEENDMKILAILGSPHGMKGSTGQLLTEVLHGAQNAGATTALLSLADYDVKPCQACNVCHKTGTCAIHDDYGKFKAALLNADGVILASPNYIFSVSAQMKAMMDRCCGPLHCVALRDKYAAAVVTSGGGGEDSVGQYLLRFLQSMGCWAVGAVGAKGAELADSAAKANRFEAARDLGAQLVRSIQDRSTFPEQVAPRMAFQERMKHLVESQKDAWTFEYEYWQSHG